MAEAELPRDPLKLRTDGSESRARENLGELTHAPISSTARKAETERLHVQFPGDLGEDHGKRL